MKLPGHKLAQLRDPYIGEQEPCSNSAIGDSFAYRRCGRQLYTQLSDDICCSVLQTPCRNFMNLDLKPF